MEGSAFSHFSGFRYHSITFGLTVSHAVIRVQSFLKTTYRLFASHSFILFRYNIHQFWYYSVIIFLVCIGYDYMILVVSTGKMGVLKMIIKIALRFHSFMSPF